MRRRCALVSRIAPAPPRGTVRNVVQVRIMRHHAQEDIALDAHEAGGRLRHLDEAVAVGIGADLFLAVADRVEGEFGVAILELDARRPRRQAGGRPVHALHRVDARRDVAIGEKQAADGLRGEGEIGIDPEQMGQRFVGQETNHHLVARPGDQALGMHVQDRVEAEPLIMQRHLVDAGHVVHADGRDVARRREHSFHGPQGAIGKHGVAPSIFGVEANDDAAGARLARQQDDLAGGIAQERQAG